MEEYRDAIASWQGSLSDGADLLIYGCDFAGSAQGREMVETLSTLTGADVAASTDKTGVADKGGDWELEYAAGDIEAEIAFSGELQQEWQGTLIDYVVSNTNDSGGGSLREAIDQSNLSVGVYDNIYFAIGSGQQTISLSSGLTITDAVNLDATTQPGFVDKPIIELDGTGAGAGTDGLLITADDSIVRGLLINNFLGDGIEINGGDNNQILGNFIGVDFEGDDALGNGGKGIRIDSGNSNIIGGSASGDGNVISGNASDGITLRNNSDSNVIKGNLIGTDVTGTADLGNGLSGVFIGSSSQNNIIGGGLPGEGNVIAYNNDDGILIAGGGISGNTISGNSIHSNSEIGIDLGDEDVTQNDGGDGDSGENALQNFPVLTDVTWSSTDVTIDGTLNSAASTTYRVEFFANTTVDTSGYGEGQTYLGFVDVTTDGSGNASFSRNLTVAVPAGASYTATATDPAGNTSEFSLASGMVAHYRLDEGSGLVAIDSSGRGLDGVLEPGVGYTGGVSGTAGDLTAAADYIEVADNDDLDIGTGDFSIDMWFNTTESLPLWDTYPMLAYKRDPSVSEDNGYELFFMKSVGSDPDALDLYWKIWDGGAIDSIVVDGSVTPLNDGQWHHVAATRNGNTLELYIDGVLAASTSSAAIGSADIQSPDPLVFGGGDSGQSWWEYNGLIDEISIYNRAIGAAEAADLASAPLVVDITETLVAPTIDGTVDAAWSSALAHNISIISGTVTDANDLSGTWRSLWDSTNLYYLVEVTDDTLINDSVLQPWQDDSVEIFIDADNSKLGAYDLVNDFQYGFRWSDPGAVHTGSNSVPDTTGVVFNLITTASGYTLEASIPWTTLGVVPSIGSLVGVDMTLADDDDGGDRDGKRLWFDGSDSAWFDPSLMGTGRLVASVSSIDITGTVFEDVDGDANLGDAVGRDNVVVRLFRDGGDGLADGADDTFVTSTLTAGGGAYSFTGLADDTYWVVVDSKTISPTQGTAAPSSVWAEQTYGVAGAMDGVASFLGASGALYGGRDPNVSDSSSDAPASLATSEHVTRVVIAGAGATNVDSAFSFNVVTNVRGDGGDDDGGGTGRHSQGTLDQFIMNANLVNGANAMRFVPAVGPNVVTGAFSDDGNYTNDGGDDWWRIDVTSALPTISGANTTIDGTAYSHFDGTVVADTNAGQAGTGGTVGVDGLTLDRVDRPELELSGGNAFTAPGLHVTGGAVTIQDIAIHGFGDNMDSEQIRIDATVTAAAGEAVITGNLIGTNADGTDAGTSENVGIFTNGAASITNNYIAYIENNAVMASLAWQLMPNVEQVNLINNEIAFNQFTGGFTGDMVSDVPSNAVIQGNYIHDFQGPVTLDIRQGKGIEIWYEAQNVLIENNTVENMQVAGIALNDGSDGNVIRRNIITGTTGITGSGGAGIVITSFNDTALAPPTDNQITENAIYNNAGLGIDLDARGPAFSATYVGDGVTANDAGDGDAGANELQNYPVLGTAASDGTDVTITGTLAVPRWAEAIGLEFFANTAQDPSTYGEGERYLGSWNVTDGGLNDLDGAERRVNQLLRDPDAGRGCHGQENS